MSLAIDWQANINIQLEEMKKQLQKKADRVAAEQISRQQGEAINKLSMLSPETASTTHSKSDVGPERICLECVELGDLNTAFSTILRHIDSTAQAKAEKDAVLGKATRAYTESLFDRLSVISNQHIREMTEGLQSVLEARINGLMEQFAQVQENINQRIEQTEYSISQLNQEVNDYEMLAQRTPPKYRPPAKVDLNLNKSYQFNFRTELTPRRQTLKRSFDLSKKQMINSRRANHPEPSKISLSITKLQKHKNELLNACNIESKV
ncbi:hypothetical protein M9Y10_046088 [Tritrichomonas musculus]|uniref:Uncharacterized protein n=1 Tax=Tritrichomonas musculus TaxID=1915356 RepID=A0ABR2JXV1_9EUKA